MLRLFSHKTNANDRCDVMLRESTQFMNNLKRAEKELKTLYKTADNTLAVSKQVMEAPLPQVFEDTAAGGPGGGTKASETIGGPGFSGEQVNRVAMEMSAKMQSGVFAPLQLWVNGYNEAVANQKKLDKLRDEVLTRRKKVGQLRREVDDLKNKQGDGNSKLALKYAEQFKRLQHKESKLALVEAKYVEEEAQQYNKLAMLIKDAVYLRMFIKTSLAEVGKSLMAASETMVIFTPEVPGAAPAQAAQQQAAPAHGGWVPPGQQAPQPSMQLTQQQQQYQQQQQQYQQQQQQQYQQPAAAAGVVVQPLASNPPTPQAGGAFDDGFTSTFVLRQ